MSKPITVRVRYSTQAYRVRLRGSSASSTSSAHAAVERIAEKVFGAGPHQVRMVRDCIGSQPGEWEITPAATGAEA